MRMAWLTFILSCCAGGCLLPGGMGQGPSPRSAASAPQDASLEQAEAILAHARALEAQALEVTMLAQTLEAEAAALALEEVSSCAMGPNPRLRRR
ncbi:MAG: hypothetical protein MUC50_06625 [Myxococcota bacterium]|jgi:hypothetical protein|nr:hypothetical protein [Myxococcota bacterium]